MAKSRICPGFESPLKSRQFPIGRDFLLTPLPYGGGPSMAGESR